MDGKIKAISLALLVLVVTIIPSLANASTPFNVVGYAIGHFGVPEDGVAITVRDTTIGDSIQTVTDSSGFFQVNLGNMPHTWSRGDTIVINASYWLGTQRYYGYATGYIGEGYHLIINVSTLYSEGIVNENFKLYTPLDIYVDSMGMLLMKLVNATTWGPVSGMSSNISCYIQYPNGTLFVDGDHPNETAAGIYTYYFNIGDVMGIYRCWATCLYENLTLMDAGLFTVKWDVYENMSRLYERIGNIIYLSHWDNYNISQQFAYTLGVHTVALNNITRTAETTDFMTNLRQIAINQAMGVIFWSVALSAFSIFGSLYYTHRKGKRERERMYATTSVPQAFVSEVIRTGLKRRKV
jgi:hypothetical protein